MANLIDNSNKYQEVLSMSFVNNEFTLLLDKYYYSKKNIIKIKFESQLLQETKIFKILLMI